MCITRSVTPFILGGTNKNMSWGSCFFLATWFGWGSGHPKSAFSRRSSHARWYPHGPWPMAALRTTSLSKKNGYILLKYITVFIYIYINIYIYPVFPFFELWGTSYYLAALYHFTNLKMDLIIRPAKRGWFPNTHWMKTPCAKPLEVYPRGPTSRSMWNINHWSFSERLSPWLFYISKRLPHPGYLPWHPPSVWPPQSLAASWPKDGAADSGRWLGMI